MVIGLSSLVMKKYFSTDFFTHSEWWWRKWILNHLFNHFNNNEKKKIDLLSAHNQITRHIYTHRDRQTGRLANTHICQLSLSLLLACLLSSTHSHINKRCYVLFISTNTNWCVNTATTNRNWINPAKDESECEYARASDRIITIMINETVLNK